MKQAQKRGPMTTTPDGSPVTLYRLLPAAGEPEIIHAAIPPTAPVLELGSGPGRITHRLLALDHPVVAVDESPEMLAHIHGAETLCARIDDLDLTRRFPVVLLASHLINGPNRRSLLTAARRHLAPDGQLLVEWHPPAWFDQVTENTTGRLGDIAVTLEDLHREGDHLSATVRYTRGEQTWTHPFTATRFPLEPALGEAGLVFTRWLTADRDWFSTRSPHVG